LAMGSNVALFLHCFSGVSMPSVPVSGFFACQVTERVV
jgi:hypothetical protein